VSVLALATLSVSLLFGVQGYYQHFQTHNPPLFAALAGPTIPGGSSGVVDAATSGPTVQTRRLDATFTNVATLSSVEYVDRFWRAGEPVTISLHWRGVSPDAAEATEQLRLLQSGYRPVAEWSGKLGLTLDGAGDQSTSISLKLPTNVEGPDFLMLETRVQDWQDRPVQIQDASGRPAGDAVLAGPIHLAGSSSWPPDGARRTAVWYGVEMRLDGISTENAPDASGSLPIVLYWTAPDYPDRLKENRVVEITVEDLAGQQLGGAKGEPGEGWFPTGEWLPGERIVDEWDVPLTSRSSDGHYRIRVDVSGQNGNIEPLGVPVFEFPTH
jgi:hypothetical protein